MPTRALLLTDVVDSTRLVEKLGDVAAADLWSAHDRLARDLLPTHAGFEIDKTDGFLLLFESVADAANYAVAYHAALRRLSDDSGHGLSARAGLHWGNVVLRHNLDTDVARGAKPLEVEGVNKPIAARIMSLAGAGQTLLSAAAAAELEGSPLRLLSHGHWRMKGVAEPMELIEVGDDTAPFVVPPDAAKVYRVVRRGEAWVPVAEIPHNLPTRRDSFVGRSHELGGLMRAVNRGPIATLVGPGGTGKTRLSLEFARVWRGDWPGGVWFVELEEVRSAAGLLSALSVTLGISLDGADPAAWLAGVLRERPPTLLVLDNFEQLVEQGASLVERLSELAPSTCWVISSREALRVRGEVVLRLDALDVPSTGAPLREVETSAAVQLFVERASSGRPFVLNAENAAAVGDLVRLLDGLPLAIELAAARARVLSPSKMVDRMSQRFRLLAGGRRGASSRQATLHGAIDWSWQLLEPCEQLALAQCTAFRGGFDLEAAEAVLDVSAWPDAPWPMDLVQTLVDKSLLRTWRPDGDPPRHELTDPVFGMYVSIQEFAAEKLATDGSVVLEGRSMTGPDAVRQTRRRHAEHYAAGDDEDFETTRLAALRWNPERENLVWAFRTAERDDATLAATLWMRLHLVANELGPASLAGDLTGGLRIDGIEDAEVLTRLLDAVFHCQITLGNYDEAEVAAHRLADFQEEAGNLKEAVAARANAISHNYRDPDLEAMQALLDRAREVGATKAMVKLEHNLALLLPYPQCEHALRAIADAGGPAAISAAYNLGAALNGRGETEESEKLARWVLAQGKAKEDPLFEMLGVALIGHAVASRWDLAGARPYLLEALQQATRLEQRRWQYGGPCLLLSIAEAEAGEISVARSRLAVALPMSRAMGDPDEIAWMLSACAHVELYDDQTQRARELLLEADEIAPGLRDTASHISVWIRSAWERLGDA